MCFLSATSGADKGPHGMLDRLLLKLLLDSHVIWRENDGGKQHSWGKG